MRRREIRRQRDLGLMDVERQHGAGGGSVRQWRVVAQAQIAFEPDDLGHAALSARRQTHMEKGDLGWVIIEPSFALRMVEKMPSHRARC